MDYKDDVQLKSFAPLEDSSCNISNYTSFKSWSEKYEKSLEKKIFVKNPESGTWGEYFDPDSGENEEYYSLITDFLNMQEKKFFKKEEGYQYELKNIGGKSVKCRIVVKKDSDELFLLKTDQFGFSAPYASKGEPDKSHPYSVYYYKEAQKGEKCAAIKNIAKWVYITRCIGGSFLWPEEEGHRQPPFNLDRGGSKKSKGRRYYINDRVDLTLLELSHFFDVYTSFGIERETVCRKCLIKKYNEMYLYEKLGSATLGKSKNLFTWLKHFDSFETYSKFFMFDGFLNDKFEVMDICEPHSVIENSDKNKADLNKKFWETQFESVFEYLCSKITERSWKIMEVIHDDSEK